MINGICEIVIAGLSVIIACLQLKLSKQINTQNISKERGYFIVEETNIRNKADTDYERCIGLFDLRGALHFHLYGNGDVFLLKKQIIINGIIVENKEPLETFFSIHEQDLPFGTLIPLKESDFKKQRLDIEINLKLKNITGNIYTEKILLVFVKKDVDNEWFLHKRNTSFKFK